MGKPRSAGPVHRRVFTLIDEVTRAPSDNPVIRCLREIQVVGPAEHTVLVNPRGQEIAIQDSAAPILDRAGNLIGAVMVFHDVSKERRLHRALHYQASHDALTGLINRREFESRLTAAVEGARQGSGSVHALLYLDLDQFKLVNDTCGHPAGDQLLKQITGVLQSRLRSATRWPAWAAMSSESCCPAAASIKRSASRRPSGRPFGTIDSCGGTAAWRSASASESWKSPGRRPTPPT